MAGKLGLQRGVLLLTLVVCGRSLAGQRSDVPGGPPPFPGSRTDKVEPAEVRLHEQQQRTQNDERQKRLVADTARLYELAGQLKADVAKSDKNTLSLEVIKKAEEIEKLARNVKDRMRG